MARAAAEAETAPESPPADLLVADACSVASQVVIAGESRLQWLACSLGSPRRTAAARLDACSAAGGRSKSDSDSPGLVASLRLQADTGSV